MLRVLLASLIPFFLSGCYRALAVPEIFDATRPLCSELERGACQARADCAVAMCTTCDDQPSFRGCFANGDATPSCPPLSCLTCSDHKDASSCEEDSPRGCVVDICCGFRGCLDPNEPPPPCETACPSPCADLEEASCSNGASCHALYEEDACDIFDCNFVQQFIRCAEGAPNCGSAQCDRLPPRCATGFVPSVAAGCWDGCVAETACR